MASNGKNFGEETKKIIRGLVTSSPYECNIAGLCKDFFETVGYPIPNYKLGFSNVEDYLRSISDTVQLRGTGMRAAVLMVASEKSAHIDKMVQTQKKSRGGRTVRRLPARSFSRPSTSHHAPPVRPVRQPQPEQPANDEYYSSHLPSEIQRNLKRLIQDFPDGILCTQLLDEYERRFRTRINYQKYSCTSVFKMCADLPRIFKFHKVSDDDYLLYDANTDVKFQPVESKEIINETCNEDLKGELLEIDWEIATSLIPPDVMHLTETIKRYFVGDDVLIKDYIDVLVGEIYDPSKFYVYLREGGLVALMKNLQDFYNVAKNRINIPVPLQEEGLYCVTLFMGDYHRAVIVSLLPMKPGQIRVLYMDYGTVGNVDYTDVFYLHKQFSTLPCQAMRARLSNIIPPVVNASWSMESRNRFRELLKDREICAEVTKIDREEHILEIYLADITDEKNIFYINDVLVNEKYANYADQEREMYDFGTFTPIPKYIHLYPTFLEIEMGVAPNSVELAVLQRNGITMDQYMPLYFRREYTENWEEIVKTHLDTVKENEHCDFDNAETVDDSCVDMCLFPSELWDELRQIAGTKDYKVTYNGEELCSSKEKAGLVELSGSCNRKRIVDLLSSEDGTARSSGEAKSKSGDSKESQDSAEKSNQYSCNRRRISSLMNSVESESFSGNKTILNNFKLKDSNVKQTNYKSTNPFLNDFADYKIEFQPNNPFLYDFEEGSDLFAEKTNSPNNFGAFSLPEFESKVSKMIDGQPAGQIDLAPEKFIIPDRKPVSPEERLILPAENPVLREKPVFREINPQKEHTETVKSWGSVLDCSSSSPPVSPKKSIETAVVPETKPLKIREKYAPPRLAKSQTLIPHSAATPEPKPPTEPVINMKPDWIQVNGQNCYSQNGNGPPQVPQFNPAAISRPVHPQNPQTDVMPKVIRPPPGFHPIPPMAANCCNFPGNFNQNFLPSHNPYVSQPRDCVNFQFINFYNLPPVPNFPYPPICPYNPNFQNKP